MADVAVLPAGSAVLENYIAGLTPTWTSSGGSGGTRGTNADHIQVQPGAAWIPSLGYVVNVPSALRPASNASLTASTWYYLYLYVDGSNNPQVELVTTAPAAPYKDTAKTKTSDTSRRYVAAYKTDGAGRIFNVLWNNNVVQYRENPTVAPMRVVDGQSQTTDTTASCSGSVPPGVRAVQMGAFSSGQTLRLHTDDDSTTGSAFIDPINGYQYLFMYLNASQAFQYRYDAAGGTAYVDIRGYWDNR